MKKTKLQDLLELAATMMTGRCEIIADYEQLCAGENSMGKSLRKQRVAHNLLWSHDVKKIIAHGLIDDLTIDDFPMTKRFLHRLLVDLTTLGAPE